jgi:sporulation protein YlmC with PRC-barrel domain
VNAPEVSWKAIEQGAVVLASDGEAIGTVTEIAGDAEADIFSGLVVSVSRLSANRFLPAERVTGIWADRVETSFSVEQAEQLTEYEEPVAERWQSPDDFMTRMRRFFGFYGKRGPRD